MRTRRTLQAAVCAVVVATLPFSARAQTPLASGLLRILGARLAIQVRTDAPTEVPINTPFTIPNQLVDGDGNALATAALFSTPVFVTGEISGAGLGSQTGDGSPASGAITIPPLLPPPAPTLPRSAQSDL